ncbi:MAG TPA: phosphonate metabolism protein/1,5-bisphosphokinase (PRPP-forming) PhnN [Alphaproteobacteria bacterium]|jgi:phosphonate metabolism protein PhnN/1,5-bisphosphokinase (PRPP-forming)|nr:phosphonate metabolism protein/1,5-bisphosphokinase (PRPP-forming) PhnN [Alphaproteobacteria bacterium]
MIVRQARRGLVLVVGPSGSGKDTLIAGARAALADSADYVFPRREITRAAEAGGEPHVAVSEAEFGARLDAGRYALAWQAHGLSYGIPTEIVGELEAGRAVVVNVSRTVIDDARRRFVRVHVVRVAVDEAALRERLAARGREDPAAVAGRLARAGLASGDAGDVVIDNSGAIEPAVAAFTAFLRSLQPASA